MIVGISAAAEADIAEGYWFYERHAVGLGDSTYVIDSACGILVLYREHGAMK